jgi:hypothetical protein
VAHADAAANRVAAGAPRAWAALAVTSARGDAPTVDEFVYPPEGAYYLRTGDLLFNPQNPPLIKLLGGAALLLHGARLDLAAQWRTNFGRLGAVGLQHALHARQPRRATTRSSSRRG